MVYNQDFVERNFQQQAELKGVFTLGEKQKDALEKIAAAKAETDRLTKRIEDLNYQLLSPDETTGKKAEMAVLEAGLKDKCWSQKQKHDAKLHGAFEGYRGSSEKFKNKVINEAVKTGLGFVRSMKADVAEWLDELKSGDLSLEDFEDLMRGEQDLMKVTLLTEKGLSDARIERFRNAVVDCVVNAAKSVV